LAAQVTGTKTVTKDASPNATAAVLTALLATPIENLTISQFQMLADVYAKCPAATPPARRSAACYTNPKLRGLKCFYGRGTPRSSTTTALQ
jgi:hypothetical protein